VSFAAFWCGARLRRVVNIHLVQEYVFIRGQHIDEAGILRRYVKILPALVVGRRGERQEIGFQLLGEERHRVRSQVEGMEPARDWRRLGVGGTRFQGQDERISSLTRTLTTVCEGHMCDAIGVPSESTWFNRTP
jgi:hypothetical protein